MEIFEKFDNGRLALPERVVDFKSLKWNEHPSYEGVALKHIVTAKDCGGLFSYHLVRIAPNCKIELHTHETQLETHEVVAGSGICLNNGVSIDYMPGIISIMPAKVEHEVTAVNEGLYLFAKFIPALC